MARRVFDSNSFGKLKLIGALLDAMELVDDGRLAVLYLDDDDAGGVRLHAQRHRRPDQPAADRARDPGGRVLQGRADGEVRVSMRSKYDVDVRAGRGTASAAAATRTPPASPSPARWRCSRDRGSCDRERARAARSRRPADTGRACMNGVLVVDKPAGPTSHDVVARRATRAGRRAHRPHRHARSARDRRAAARRRTRDAAGAVPDAATTRSTSRGFGSASRRRPTMPRGSAELRRGRRRRLPRRLDERAVERRSPDVHGDLPADAAAVFREEGRRDAGVHAGPAAQAGRDAGRSRSPFRRSSSRATPRVWRDVRVVVLERLLRPVAGTRPGQRLGCGAHLEALRRTRAGEFTLDEAVPLERSSEGRRGGRDAAGRDGPAPSEAAARGRQRTGSKAGEPRQRP